MQPLPKVEFIAGLGQALKRSIRESLDGFNVYVPLTPEEIAVLEKAGVLIPEESPAWRIPIPLEKPRR